MSVIVGNKYCNVTVKNTTKNNTDYIYADNYTDKELVDGDKVYLNTNLTETQYQQNIVYRENNSAYSVGNNLYYGGKYKLLWDGEKFTSQNIGSILDNISSNILYRPNSRFVALSDKIIKDDGSLLKLNIGAQILNKYYCKKYRDYSEYLCRYDYATGIVDTTELCLFRSTYAYRENYYCPDDSKKYACVYDYQGAKKFLICEDIEKGQSSPIEREYTLSSSFYPIYFTDDFNIGSYAIGTNANGTTMNQNNNFYIYRFYSDGFYLATDLPESLSSLMGTNRNGVVYNNLTKVLTVFDGKGKLYVYKIGDDGLFHQIPMELDIPVISVDSYKKAVFSDDMSTLILCYGNSYKGYETAIAYKLNYMDGKFRATNFVEWTDKTLTGFATGNIDDKGRVEVKSVLPPKISLTFNVTPDPDSIDIKGVLL